RKQIWAAPPSTGGSPPVKHHAGSASTPAGAPIPSAAAPAAAAGDPHTRRAPSRPSVRSRRRAQRMRAVERASEDQAPIGDRVPHPDLLVNVDRDGVVAADEQADRRDAGEQKAAEIAKPTLCVAAASRLRVNPHLLQLNRARRPRRGFGLEQDRPTLGPQPRAPLVDLGTRTPAE